MCLPMILASLAPIDRAGPRCGGVRRDQRGGDGQDDEERDDAQAERGRLALDEGLADQAGPAPGYRARQACLGCDGAHWRASGTALIGAPPARRSLARLRHDAHWLILGSSLKQARPASRFTTTTETARVRKPAVGIGDGRWLIASRSAGPIPGQAEMYST